MTLPNISILVPTRNEQDSIVNCLTQLCLNCPGAEIIVIDGGHDETSSLVKRQAVSYPSIRYLKNDPDLGKGHAIQRGIEASRGNILVQFDADLQFDPREIPLLTGPILRGEADMVLATRFTKESRRMPGSDTFVRTQGNRVISGYTSLLCGKPFSDVLAGFKAWKKEVTGSLPLTSLGYSYEAELVINAFRKGWRVVEVPVSYYEREFGSSSVAVFRVGLRMLWDLFRFRFRSIESS